MFSLTLLGDQNTRIQDTMTRCSPKNNFDDQSHLSVKLTAGKLYTLQIRLHCIGSRNSEYAYGQDPSLVAAECDVDHYVNAWIDLNNDGQFDSVTERAVQDTDTKMIRGSIQQTYTLNVFIPETKGEVHPGEPYRMRVVLARDEGTCKPCYNNGHGEARDYTLFISENSYD